MEVYLKTNQMDTKASSPGSEMAQKDRESKFGSRAVADKLNNGRK